MGYLKRKWLNSTSKVVLYLIFAIVLVFHFTLPKYDYPDQTNEFAWDILSYYLYLPSTFINGDVGLNDPAYIQNIFDKYHFSPAFYQAAQAPNGNWVMIYTMGMAILYAPFYFIGYLWAQLSGYPLDAFSYPFQRSISCGMMIYVLLGVYYLRKILLNYYSEKITSIVLVIIILGTNYFREATDYNLGPHAVLFFFYAVLVYNTLKWHQRPSLAASIFIGISLGFLILIRPTEIIAVFIPLLWGIYDKNSFRFKLNLVRDNIGSMVCVFISMFLVGLPQLIYWKIQTGSFLYNSYWNQNSFDINSSYFLKVFFSIRKGWFVYTPLIILSFLGFYYIFKKKKFENVRLPFLIFIFCNIFILTHVPVWHNAGSFGQRFMVQSYLVLSIPLGAFVQKITELKTYIKIPSLIIILFFIFLNLFQTWQFVRWILPGDGITWEYYKYAFFKTTYITDEEKELLQLQRTFDPNEKFENIAHKYNRRLLVFINYDNASSASYNSQKISKKYYVTAPYSYIIDSSNVFSNTFKKEFSSLTSKDHLWFKLSVDSYNPNKKEETVANIVIHFEHNGNPYNYAAYKINNEDFENQWKHNEFYYLSPPLQDESDMIVAYVWFERGKEMYIDNFCLEIFERKDFK
jgi:hypothetical protein